MTGPTCWPYWRSEERRVGKSGDLGVTGVQTCALPILTLTVVERIEGRLAPNLRPRALIVALDDRAHVLALLEIGRASCGKEWRSRCDWSSDVCSSDLDFDGRGEDRGSPCSEPSSPSLDRGPR